MSARIYHRNNSKSWKDWFFYQRLESWQYWGENIATDRHTNTLSLCYNSLQICCFVKSFDIVVVVLYDFISSFLHVGCKSPLFDTSLVLVFAVTVRDLRHISRFPLCRWLPQAGGGLTMVCEYEAGSVNTPLLTFPYLIFYSLLFFSFSLQWKSLQDHQVTEGVTGFLFFHFRLSQKYLDQRSKILRKYPLPNGKHTQTYILMS